MLFAVLCDDREGALDLRLQTRPAHVDYLNGLGDRLVLAGPFLGAEGSPVGSLLVVDAADEAAAGEIADGDPYAKAGLFERVTIRRWNWTIKNPGV